MRREVNYFLRRVDVSKIIIIELSIVLVITGFVGGGVREGQDLVWAAGERAPIRQIARYDVAVATFRGGTGCLPEDILPGPATLFRSPWARRIFYGDCEAKWLDCAKLADDKTELDRKMLNDRLNADFRLKRLEPAFTEEFEVYQNLMAA